MLKMNKPDQKLRSTKRIKESNAQTRPRHHGGPARKHAPPCAIALVRTRNLVPSLYCTEKALTTKIMFWSKLPTPHSRGTPQALNAKLICTSRLSSGMKQKQKPAHNNPTPLYFTDKSSTDRSSAGKISAHRHSKRRAQVRSMDVSLRRR
jgi:hypothetical protein